MDGTAAAGNHTTTLASEDTTRQEAGMTPGESSMDELNQPMTAMAFLADLMAREPHSRHVVGQIMQALRKRDGLEKMALLSAADIATQLGIPENDKRRKRIAEWLRKWRNRAPDYAWEESKNPACRHARYKYSFYVVSPFLRRRYFLD